MTQLLSWLGQGTLAVLAVAAVALAGFVGRIRLERHRQAKARRFTSGLR